MAIGPELPALIVAHHEETNSRLPLAVGWQELLRLESQGMLCILTARDGPRLVGYVCNLVRSHLFAVGTLHGFVEAYYLLPEYRRGWNGYNLLKRNDEMLVQVGCKLILITAEMRHKQGRSSALLKRLGYAPEATTWVKLV